MDHDAVQLDMFRDVHHQLGFLIDAPLIIEPNETIEEYTGRLASLYTASAVQYHSDLSQILDTYEENASQPSTAPSNRDVENETGF